MRDEAERTRRLEQPRNFLPSLFRVCSDRNRMGLSTVLSRPRPALRDRSSSHTVMEVSRSACEGEGELLWDNRVSGFALSVG